MTRLTAKEIEAFEATRDIEAEILQGIDDMLANNAAKRTVITETDVALARRKADLTQEQIDEIRSILEGAKALSKPTQRKSIVEDKSNKLNILIKLEDEIINFDAEQRKAAINLINGPQRIRGLAGSGKTIILAMNEKI